MEFIVNNHLLCILFLWAEVVIPFGQTALTVFCGMKCIKCINILFFSELLFLLLHLVLLHQCIDFL